MLLDDHKIFIDQICLHTKILIKIHPYDMQDYNLKAIEFSP